MQDRKDFDQRILEAARKEIAAEEQKKKEMQKKVLEQKRLRDIMMEEARVKAQNENDERQNEERDRVKKLAKELEKEKEQKLITKEKQREAAMKVIQENKQEKKKRMEEIEEQRKKDAQDVERMIQNGLAAEKKRADEIKAREERIQKTMDRMADVVVNKDKEMQKKQEREYIQQCIEKDEQAHLQDINKKQQDRQRAKALNDVLTAQMNEKKLRNDGEHRADMSYMNRWMEHMEVDNKKRNLLDKARKDKIKENQAFIKQQMADGVPNSKKGPEMLLKKKNQLGGLMDPEEAKMNRELLKEIAKVKRGEEPSSKLQRQVNNPI